MEMSVREARAQFASALAAAERGERVSITKNGKAVAELGPPTPPAARPRLDAVEMERVRLELGIVKPDRPLDETWLREFTSPDWSEELFGADYR